MEINLIKVDSKGKIRELNIWNEGGELKRTSGILGGNLIENGKTCKPKNVGKSNETSAEQQAELEVKAESRKKLDEGYVLVPNMIDYVSDQDLIEYIEKNRTQVPSPMLAKVFDEKYVDVVGGFLCSAKLDGMRCLAVIEEGSVKLYSRGSKEITTMNHIVEQLERLRDEHGFTGILDGELYSHKEDDENFQDIMKAIKKYRKGISEQVQYFVYDLLAEGIGAKERYEKYYELLIDAECLVSVEPLAQYHENDIDNIYKMHELFLDKGYEGTMIKNASSLYKDSRSSDLLKLKDFQDDEFEILDVVPMDNRPECGKIVMKIGDGTFTATPKCSNAEKAEMLQNKHDYIGKLGTVTYFGFTDAGKPRIAVFKGVRLVEDLDAA